MVGAETPEAFQWLSLLLALLSALATLLGAAANWSRRTILRSREVWLRGAVEHESNPYRSAYLQRLLERTSTKLVVRTVTPSRHYILLSLSLITAAIQTLIWMRISESAWSFLLAISVTLIAVAPHIRVVLRLEKGRSRLFKEYLEATAPLPPPESDLRIDPGEDRIKETALAYALGAGACSLPAGAAVLLAGSERLGVNTLALGAFAVIVTIGFARRYVRNS